MKKINYLKLLLMVIIILLNSISQKNLLTIAIKIKFKVWHTLAAYNLCRHHALTKSYTALQITFSSNPQEVIVPVKMLDSLSKTYSFVYFGYNNLARIKAFSASSVMSFVEPIFPVPVT